MEIRPLTIMLGANGSGKTAILRFLMMLHQTSQSFDHSKGPFAFNGHYVELGEAGKIIRGGKLRQEWSFSIGLDQAMIQNSFQETLDYLYSGIQRSVDRILYYIDMQFRRNQAKEEDLETPFKEIRKKFGTRRDSDSQSPMQRFIEMADIYLELDSLMKKLGKNFLDSEIDEDDLTIFDLRFIRQRSGQRQVRRFIQPDSISSTEIIVLKKYLLAINEHGFFECRLHVELKKSHDNQFSVSCISIRNGKTIIEMKLSLENGSYKVEKVNSDFAQSSEINKYHKVIEKSLRSDKTIFRFIEYRHSSDNLTPLFISAFFAKLIEECETQIDEAEFIHIPPIRPFLERYITNSGRAGGAVGTAASDLLDYLSQEKVKQYVDGWFDEFEIEFRVNQITELLREVVVFQKVSDLELSLKDVGFGYSQVLPIIIESIARPDGSLTLIEQPEVHLHPKMQAKMADFFIECAGIRSDQRTKERRNFVVETHSENFLKRLRRRIAEGSVNAQDVAIYFFEKVSNDQSVSTVTRRVDISDSGDISWPKEFYATDLEDTRAFVSAHAQRLRKSGDKGDNGESSDLRNSS
jgi:AAA ATPase domain